MRSAERAVPDRTAAVRRGAARLCTDLLWPHLHEMPLPGGRRADILALRPDGGFVVVEIKSGRADFAADLKWQDYRAFCDVLYFAVDPDFPRAILPDGPGVIVADETGAAIVGEGVAHPLSPARRRALLHRFAALAATRLAAAGSVPDRAPHRPD